MITIIALPRGGPHIQGVEQDVKIGDSINLNCTSLKSKPAANLTFYINGKNVSILKFRNLNCKFQLTINKIQCLSLSKTI